MLELLNVWTVALAVLAVAAPAVGTVHVVLTKRKPHAAMAWVGVLWLAPLLGAAFYVLFGVNRTRRRARAIRMVEEVRDGTANLIACPGETLKELLGPDGGHLQPLATLGDRVAGRPLVAGNRVRMLRDGDQAYPAMLEAIAEAESTVTLITYIFDRDRAGRQFVDALAAAVDRGWRSVSWWTRWGPATRCPPSPEASTGRASLPGASTASAFRGLPPI
jgi:cardiolipin synthase A/B